MPPSTAVQRLLLAPTEHPVATLPGQEPDTTVVTIQNGGPQAASPALPIGQQTVSQNERNQQLRAQPSQEQTQVGDFPIIGASRQLAMLVARYARALACIEWRDMERLMAEVFESLGFAAALTPPSKDGGEDVIVTCEIKGQMATYFVEVKHWRSATKVGSDAVQDLLNVVVAEKVAGCLFLSTYGFIANAFEQLTVVGRQRVWFGDQDKIASLCKTYVKAKSGVWSPPEDLSELVRD